MKTHPLTSSTPILSASGGFSLLVGALQRGQRVSVVAGRFAGDYVLAEMGQFIDCHGWFKAPRSGIYRFFPASQADGVIGQQHLGSWLHFNFSTEEFVRHVLTAAHASLSPEQWSVMSARPQMDWDHWHTRPQPNLDNPHVVVLSGAEMVARYQDSNDPDSLATSPV